MVDRSEIRKIRLVAQHRHYEDTTVMVTEDETEGD
jgi:hypothetical protein